MKKGFVRPDLHLVKLDNLPPDTAIETLSDEQLLALMERSNYHRNKRCFRASENFVLRQVAGELILVPVGEDCINGMVTFNGTGTYLWQQLERPSTEADLVYALKTEYNVTEETAQADVRLFLNNALECGMVCVC